MGFLKELSKFSTLKSCVLIKDKIKFIRTNPYPSINQSQISDKAITLITQPKENNEERPKIFLIFFCFTLLNLLVKTFITPNKIKITLELNFKRIKGINFCQTDNNQMFFQEIF